MTRTFWVNLVTSPEVYIVNVHFPIETLIELRFDLLPSLQVAMCLPKS